MANPFDQFDAPSANPFDQFDAPAAPEQPKPSSLARRALGDTAVSLAKGVVGTGEAAVGLADLATGGYAGKALSDATGFNPKATKAALDSLYSPEQQKANQAVQGAEGFGNTLGAIARNPSVALQAIAESAPAMLGGGAVAQGIGRVGLAGNALARGALGEGIVGAGQQAEQFRQDNPEGTLNGRQTLASLASGAGTAAFSALGGKAAQKLGIGDVDTALAGGAGKIAPQSLARRVGEGFVSEGLLEEMPQSVWEQGAQNFGNDKPLTEGMGNAAARGLVTGGVMGAGFNALQSPVKQPQGRPMQPPADLAAKAPPANPLATPGENIALQQQILDEQEQLAASINPADGPLSSAASLAVQTGAAKTPTQLAIEERQRAAELATQQDDAESEIYGSTGADAARTKPEDAAPQAQAAEPPAQVPIQEWINQQVGVGSSAGVKRNDFVQAAKEQAEPTIVLDEQGRPYTTTSKLDIQQFQADFDRRQSLRQRNVEAANRLKAGRQKSSSIEDDVTLLPLPDEVGQRAGSPETTKSAVDIPSAIANGARLQGRSLVDQTGNVTVPNLNIQQYRAATKSLKQNQTNAQQNPPQATPAQAQQAETQGQEQPAAPQPVAPSPENQDGTARPSAGSVSSGSDSQGSVDARSVVDNRADRGSGYERAGEGDATAEPAPRVPSAGAGGKRAKPTKLLKRGRSAEDVSAAINEIASLAGRAPEQTREAYDRWVSDSGRDRADEILFANLEKYRKQKGEDAPAATNQPTIKNEPRADAGPMVEAAPADQTLAKKPAAEQPAEESATSPLASLFFDLDSTSTRKANKASRAAQSHPKAAEIDYVQKNFHDVLLRLMEEGKLTVNGVSSVSEENSQCL